MLQSFWSGSGRGRNMTKGLERVMVISVEVAMRFSGIFGFLKPERYGPGEGGGKYHEN